LNAIDAAEMLYYSNLPKISPYVLPQSAHPRPAYQLTPAAPFQSFDPSPLSGEGLKPYLGSLSDQVRHVSPLSSARSQNIEK
jgi:hypothetical protein